MRSFHYSRKKVNLDAEPFVKNKLINKYYKPSTATYATFSGCDVTDSMLSEAACLFNENYGVWGTHPEGFERVPKPGNRVKLSKDRLRQYLPENVDCSYAKVTVDGHLAGNAFACRWKVEDDKTVCWITQLVIHSDYRERGLAVGLLNWLRRDEDHIYGLMSSHPAACLAASKAFVRGGINCVSMRFIRDHANTIMRHSPIDYIRNAELRGNLFEPNDKTGAISSVCTNFFVDHVEPLDALNHIRGSLSWPLGELLDGHEFLFIVDTESRRRSRSRFRSASEPAV